MPATIRHGSAQHLIAVCVGWTAAVSVLAAGIATHGSALLVIGGLAAAFMVLFTRSTRSRLRSGRPALMRDGDLLVGDDLPRALRVEDTTYEIVSDHEGGWVVLLRSGDQQLRLAAGGWSVDGERWMTRKATARVLGELGIAAARH